MFWLEFKYFCLFMKTLNDKDDKQVLNNKNVLTSMLNLGAILNFHTWQH
jgi:hypothetical protein